MSAPTRPRFSVVSAVYDVAPYLPDFIESIERQDLDLARVEVIVVDDGSTDDSRAVLEAWAARRPGLVRVLSQENAGQGAARNAGLAAARGEWVTFPDPDDAFDPDYLSTVDAFLEEHRDTVMVATGRILWNDTTGATANSHPLRRMFTYDRLVDLDLAESTFHGSAPAAFFCLDLLREHDVRFDVRIRPNFEDGHFCSSYLLRCDRPLVGLIGSTRYHYRKRADQSSSLQRSMLDPRRYTDVFEFGYLAVVDEALERHGRVPLWLQHFLCYEMLGYLVAYDVSRMPVIEPGPATEAFHRGLRRILEACDLDRVLPRLEFGSTAEHRVALQHGALGTAWHDDEVWVDRFDPAQRLARVRYHFTGEAPDEQVFNGEVPTGPVHAKTRELAWFGRVLVRERILWVRFAPDLRVRLDGRWADVVFERRHGETTRVLPRDVRRLTGSPSRQVRQLVARATPEPTTRLGRRARLLAARPAMAGRFADAWVLADHVDGAGGNAEALFRWLRADRPDLNAWFVVARGTPAWQRLRAEFGRRVVAHGSLTWRVLMSHCSQLLSSSTDPAVVDPPEIAELREADWRFTFLQHGVITDDRAQWIGDRRLDVLVSSTQGEHDALAGDGTPYPFTTREVQLTGLPRHDALLEAARTLPAVGADVVLLAPTWRLWLTRERGTASGRPELLPGAGDSDFVRRWAELAGSPELAAECRRRGLTLAFLAHRNVEPLLPALDLPDHVLVRSRHDGPVEDLLARTRVLVTDYSSAAFDAAYVERPVVYYQFDRELVLSGGHVGRPGWFDHERDGFGPVTGSSADAVDAIRTALEHGPASPYAERMAAAFAHRDGRCSERVVEAVVRSTQPG